MKVISRHFAQLLRLKFAEKAVLISAGREQPLAQPSVAGLKQAVATLQPDLKGAQVVNF
jgi:hypothetical protein